MATVNIIEGFAKPSLRIHRGLSQPAPESIRDSAGRRSRNLFPHQLSAYGPIISVTLNDL